jgi:hypothetical protein
MFMGTCYINLLRLPREGVVEAQFPKMGIITQNSNRSQTYTKSVDLLMSIDV